MVPNARDQVRANHDDLYFKSSFSTHHGCFNHHRSDVGAGNSTDYFASLDPSMVQLRLLVQKAEFGRVIGKGGQMIAHIRTACGAGISAYFVPSLPTKPFLTFAEFFAVVKGINVDPERRIVSVATMHEEHPLRQHSVHICMY
jgi:hypothetical protein